MVDEIKPMRLFTPAEMTALLPQSAHGGDGAILAQVLGVHPDEVLDLSASLNPFAPDAAAMAAPCLAELRRYPDPTTATKLLSDAIGVSSEHLLLTNGGSEAIGLVGAELSTGRVDEPEFSLYKRHLDALDINGQQWRSNPNNPTGLLADESEQAAVWDEAFYPLATGTWTRGDRDSVVIGSLTKLFACPGLRIGYVISEDDAFIKRLSRRQPVWSVNSLALSVLPSLLEMADLSRWAQDLSKLRCELTELLSSFGYSPLRSDASWLLVPDARNLRAKLACQGVLVRDCTSFGLSDTIRIAVPGSDGLERLAIALKVPN